MKDEATRNDCPLCGDEHLELAHAHAPADPDPFGETGLALWLCGACGYLFRSPRPDRGAIERHYRDAPLWPSVFDPERERAIERLAASCTTGGRLLEVGCGDGRLLQALRLPDWRLVGVEPSTEAAHVARERRGYEVHSSLLETNEFPPEVFDALVCVNVVELARDTRAFLAHAERLVRPGGGLYLELVDPLRALAAPDVFAPERLGFLTPATLRRTLAELGIDAHTIESGTAAVTRVVARKVGADKIRHDDDDPAQDVAELRSVLARCSARRAA